MSAPAARLYASIALVAGPLVAFVTPPFQVADENAHWLRAFQVSEGSWIGERRGDEAGGGLPQSVLRAPMDFEQMADPAARVSAGGLVRWARTRRLGEPEPREFAAFPNTVRYPPVPYLPAAAAMALARAAHLRLGAGFYAARLATLFAAVALIAFSIRCAPPALGWPLALVALLPMSEALLSSLSADALTLAFAIANAAIAARLAADPPERRGALVVLLAATASGLALTKPVFAPFGCATALVAAARSSPRGKWALFAAAGALPLALAAAWAAAVKPLYVPLLPGLSFAAQQDWVVTHPAAAAAQIFRDVFTWKHAHEMVGVLGWLDAPVAWWVRVALLLALVAIPLAAGGMRVASWIRVVVVLAAAGMALLTGLAMLLTWTPPGAPSPQGVQGRYFLPLCPLALLALPQLPCSQPRSRHVVLLTGGACLLAAAATLWTLRQRYW